MIKREPAIWNSGIKILHRYTQSKWNAVKETYFDNDRNREKEAKTIQEIKRTIKNKIAKRHS